jgi:hypothetical protein
MILIHGNGTILFPISWKETSKSSTFFRAFRHFERANSYQGNGAILEFP